MSEFRTSQVHGLGAKSGTDGKKSNTLCVVVTEARSLRNVLKMDKQSPYITVRIQDQEESTQVMPRAGQKPYFDAELWFTLDAVEERTLYINAYHQKKQDSKLICSGEVDFTPALKKSSTEGYDGWFPLYYKGRESGKVYLEISYYPKDGEMPIGTKNAARLNMNKIVTLPASAADGTFRNTPKEKSRIHREKEEDLPALGDLRSSQMKSSINKRISRDTFKNLNTSMRGSSSSPERSNLEKINDNGSDGNNHTSNSNWLSFLDNTIKLPLLFNNISFNPISNSNKNNNNNDDSDNTFEDEVDAKCKLKVESPELLQERPIKLFNSDYEDDDDDYDDISVTDKWKKSIASRQEHLFKENKRILSSITYKSDNDNDETFESANIVNLKNSIRNDRNKELDDFKKSYQSKKLPQINVCVYNNNCTSDSESEEDLPPTPPKHTIDMGSLFESVISNQLEINAGLEKETSLPKIAATAHSIFKNINDDDESDINMSWYEKRKRERRKNRQINV
jgi:hypothetical protein